MDKLTRMLPGLGVAGELEWGAGARWCYLNRTPLIGSCSFEPSIQILPLVRNVCLPESQVRVPADKPTCRYERSPKMYLWKRISYNA